MKQAISWQKAKRLCRLSAKEVEMAKALGLKPEALVHNIPAKSGKKEDWKLSPGSRVRMLYSQRIGDTLPGAGEHILKEENPESKEQQA